MGDVSHHLSSLDLALSRHRQLRQYKVARSSRRRSLANPFKAGASSASRFDRCLHTGPSSSTSPANNLRQAASCPVSHCSRVPPFQRHEEDSRPVPAFRSPALFATTDLLSHPQDRSSAVDNTYLPPSSRIRETHVFSLRQPTHSVPRTPATSHGPLPDRNTSYLRILVPAILRLA